MMTLIKEGSVAERISQLQARMVPDNFIQPRTPSTQRTPRSPAASILSKYSTSNLRCSPKSIPLPETPVRPSGTLLYHSGSDPVESRQRILRMNRSLTTRCADDEDPIKSANGGSTYLPEFVRNNFDNIELKDGEPGGVVQTPSKVQDLETSASAGKKGSISSAGGAYSRIQPFVYSPPTASYVPKRQSQNFDVADERSPLRLRKMDSLDVINPNLYVESGSPGSPRRRNERSLRRRTFNSKSDEMIVPNPANAVNDMEQLRSASGTTVAEDIFTGRIPKPELPAPESSQVAFNDASARASLPDVTGPSYIPSIMPRQIHSRQLQRSRHQRALSNSVGRDSITKGSVNDDGIITRTTHPLIDQDGATRNQDEIFSNDASKNASIHNFHEAIVTGDGACSGYDSNVSASPQYSRGGSPLRPGNTTIPSLYSQNISVNGSKVVMGSDLSPATKAVLVPSNAFQSQQRSLKIILAIRSRTQDVIKIEVHPGPQVDLLDGQPTSADTSTC